jgi:precorrin-4/cobalt-precorrin-4 C11-methyltransferase
MSLDTTNTIESTRSASNVHPVLFVGAGPGDPELITVKGSRAMARADAVIYAGSLVPEALLTWARPGAEKLNSAGMDLTEIIDCMERFYHQGLRVVRLHTGDPSLYGAIFEQMAELTARGIPYAIVPGVTAAFAAAAGLGIEFTLPEKTQTLVLTRMSGRTPVPESESLASLAAHKASMAIYLSMALVEQVAAILAEAYGPESPCAVIYRASHPDEKILVCDLASLAARVRETGIDRQAVILVGPALEAGTGGTSPYSKLYDAGFSHGFRKGACPAD